MLQALYATFQFIVYTKNYLTNKIRLKDKRGIMTRPKKTKKHSIKKIVKKTLAVGRPIEWTEAAIAKETEALYEWMANKKNYFFTGFMNERRLHPEHLERFSQKSQRFCEALKLARQIQEQRLAEMAVEDRGNAGFIKFILQNKAGWKEKSELSGNSANPFAVILDRIAETSRLPLDDYDDE